MSTTTDKKIAAIRAEIKQLNAKGRAIIDNAEAEKRGISDAESAQIDLIVSEARALDDELDSELSTSMGRQCAGAGVPLGDPDGRFEPGRNGGGTRQPVSTENTVALANARIITPDHPARYENTFADAPTVRASEGFDSLNDMLKPIAQGLYDPRLKMASGQPSGKIGSAGGYLVGPDFTAQIFNAALPQEIVRPRARIETMISASKIVAGISHSDSSAGKFYGMDFEWLAESTSGTDQPVDVREIELHAHEGAVYSRVPMRLINDASDFSVQLTTAIADTVSHSLDRAFFTGTGAGQPLGMLNDPAKVEIAKEGSQVADTIIIENLTKMFARMYDAGRPRSVWVANATCIPELLQLTIDVGTGGAHIPVLRESDGGFTMLTRPVLFTEEVPKVGDAGDIALVDFSQYIVGLRQDFTIEQSNAPGWQKNQMAFRSVVRFDGQGSWDSVYTPLNGDTQSWIVTLAERA